MNDKTLVKSCRILLYPYVRRYQGIPGFVDEASGFRTPLYLHDCQYPACWSRHVFSFALFHPLLDSCSMAQAAAEMGERSVTSSCRASPLIPALAKTVLPISGVT